MSLRNLFGGGGDANSAPDGAPDEWRPGTDEQGVATAGADRQGGVPAATGITPEPGLTTADVAAAAATPAPAREEERAGLDYAATNAGSHGSDGSDGSDARPDQLSDAGTAQRPEANPEANMDRTQQQASSVDAAEQQSRMTAQDKGRPNQAASLDASSGPPAGASGANGPDYGSNYGSNAGSVAVSNPGPDAASRPGDGSASAASATASGSSTAPLFPEDQTEQYRGRWSDVQAGFVDEPRQAVQQADKLVAEVVQRLAQSFADERTRLERQWDRGEDVSTEDLRQALRHYRSFFDRLLSL